MTDRRFDNRHSGEILRDGSAQGASERISRGLSAVVLHARQLTRSPAGDATERLGRDRLLAAANLHARPLSTGRDPFRGRGIWARWRAASSSFSTWSTWSTWSTGSAWGAAVVCLALLGYFGSSWLNHAPRALPTSPLSAALDEPLTYRSSGGQPAASNYLVAPGHASASLLFSDGSDVTASPSSRLRVDATYPHGARVLLEQGSARANITHRDNTRWMFVAGPFDVRITGTSFTLEWDAADQVLDLTLHEGSVEVASPLGASQIKVKTGQHFHASVTEGSMQLLAAGAEQDQSLSALAQDAGDRLKPSTAYPSGTDADADKDSDAAQTDRASDRSRRGKLSRVAQRRSKLKRRAALRAERQSTDEAELDALQLASASYTDLVRAGAFEQVVSAATQAGLARTLAHNSAEDVRALADAARYLHRSELAVRSLTVLRTRFPGSHHSAAAAFLLGRTYENAEQPQAARRFYELYERETPGGEFAAEALAGRMRTVTSLEGVDAGRAIAQQYLDSYPRGVHAKTARQLLR